MTTDEFVAKAQERHPSYDYSKVDYTTTHNSIIIACPTHGDFQLKPSNHLSGQRCPACSITTPRAELEIREFLDSHAIRYIPNTRSIIPPQELDIWLPDHGFGIEHNGLYWHSDKFKDWNYHQDKWKSARAAGIQLMQIFEDEWFSNRQLVESMLLHRLKLSPERLAARKCEVVEIQTKEAGRFFSKNHIQGAGTHNKAMGLIRGGELVSVMGWYRPPISGGDRKADWIISRFASKAGLAVQGSFSRLHQAFIRANPEIKVIGTYADLRWGDGAVYPANGFEFRHTTKPNYHYILKSSDPVRRHRYGFRKHRLQEIMGDQYDGAKTERQLTEQLGLYRIYDAGNSYFEWNRTITM